MTNCKICDTAMSSPRQTVTNILAAAYYFEEFDPWSLQTEGYLI